MKKERFINKSVKKKHIGTRLRTLYIATMLIPVLVVGISLLVMTYSNQLQYHEKVLSSYNQGIRQTIYDLTTYIYNVSESIAYNDDLSKLLAGRYENKTQFMTAYNNMTIVDPYIAKYAGIGGIFIYTENETAATYGKIIKVDDTIRNTDWYKRANSQFTSFWTSYEYLDSYNNECIALTLLRKMVIVDSGETAVIMIRVSNSYLNSRISNIGYTTEMTVNQEPVFFASDPKMQGTYLDLDIDYERVRYNEERTTEYKGRKALTSITSIKPSQSVDSQIYIVGYDVNAYTNIGKIMRLILLALLVAAALPIIIIALFTRRFTKEIKTLRNEMYRASHKDDTEEETNTEDVTKMFSSIELSDAYDDLMLMVSNIEKMEAAQYEAEIREKQVQNDQQKMEIKVLSSQINPHFLYNTLEMIRMKALTNNDRDVANAIKLLGQSMRYVLENTGTTVSTLRKELDHVMNYLQIQILRFGDRLEYQVNIQPDMLLEEYEVLPLLMQPIVENAIIHGLEARESGGKVWVAIYIEENVLKVDISDNAGGMDEETLKMVLHRIEHYEKERHTFGIALYNINRRIKLNYGEKYGIDIHTVPGEGTRVRLNLPIIKQEAQNGI